MTQHFGVYIQWNLSKLDTTGTEESVLNSDSEVSPFQRLLRMYNYVEFGLENCPVCGGVLNLGVSSEMYMKHDTDTQ